jgi:hypothetical protein
MLIKESAKGRLSRRLHRLMDIASGGNVLSEDEWKDKIGEENYGIASQIGLLRETKERVLTEDGPPGGEAVSEQPPLPGAEGPPPMGDMGGEGPPSGIESPEEEAEEEMEEQEPISMHELAKFLEALKDRADEEANMMIDKAIAHEEEMEGEEGIESPEGEEGEEGEGGPPLGEQDEPGDEDAEEDAAEEDAEAEAEVAAECEGCESCGTLVVENGLIWVEHEGQVVGEVHVIEEATKKKKGGWPKEIKKGRFTEWCKRNGFKGASIECAKKAMKSDDASVRGMASFYMNTVKPSGKTASAVASEDVQIRDIAETITEDL